VRGWLRPLKQGLFRLVEIKAGILLAQPVVRRELPDANVPETVLVKTGSIDNREDLPFSVAEFHRRNEAGNSLYELWVGDSPVSYGWVANGGARIGVLHALEMTVPDHALYIWDCATSPTFRGQGYFKKLLTSIIDAHCESSTVALVAVDVGNTASRRALAGSGFKPMFTYLSVRVLGKDMCSVALKDKKVRKAQLEFDLLALD